MTAMSDKKRGLGRGLEALLGAGDAAAGAGHAAAGARPAHPHPGGPARKRQVPAARGHARGIARRTRGFHQRPGRHPADRRAPGRRAVRDRPAALRDHRRRTPLARRADGGPADVPAVVRRVDDETAVAIALIENIQREDLNPLEEARRALAADHGIRADPPAGGGGRRPLARRGVEPAAPAGTAARSSTLVEKRELEMGHARALLALTTPPAGRSAARWSRRRAFRCARPRRWCGACSQLAAGDGALAARRLSKDPDIQRLENDLADKLGATVELQHGARARASS